MEAFTFDFPLSMADPALRKDTVNELKIGVDKGFC